MTRADCDADIPDNSADALGHLPAAARLSPSRIAMVLPNLHGGGAERVALSISRELLKRGHRVDMILFRERNDYPAEVPDDLRILVLDNSKDFVAEKIQKHNPISTISGYVLAAKALKWKLGLLPSQSQIRRAIHLAHYMDQSKPNYIIPHLYRPAMVAQLASSMAKRPVPVLPVVHNVGREISNPRWRKMVWNTLRNMQKIIAVSSVVKKAVERQAKIPHSQIEVVHNGIPADSIDSLSRDRPDHKWFREPGIPVVLGVGRLVLQKDWPTLMRSFRLLRKRMECRLVILGKGQQEKCLRDLSHQLGIVEDFDNPGFTDNPYQYMRHSAVMGLSSKFEGLGMVLLEALACGCPCVSTDIGGPQEILANGRYGTLVPMGDHEAMADALEQAIRNPPPKDMLRRRAEEFSVERCVSGYERVLASVAQEAAATAFTD